MKSMLTEWQNCTTSFIEKLRYAMQLGGAIVISSNCWTREREAVSHSAGRPLGADPDDSGI